MSLHVLVPRSSARRLDHQAKTVQPGLGASGAWNAQALLVPGALRGHGNTHPEVTFSWPGDTCLGPSSKQLAPFIDGASTVSYWILKTVSKSPFFMEANKD
jgi:hypothetical protein